MALSPPPPGHTFQHRGGGRIRGPRATQGLRNRLAWALPCPGFGRLILELMVSSGLQMGLQTPPPEAQPSISRTLERGVELRPGSGALVWVEGGVDHCPAHPPSPAVRCSAVWFQTRWGICISVCGDGSRLTLTLTLTL